jgi:hypothetical protein
MTSPFRHKKKERKRLQALARKNIVAAEKFETDRTKRKSDFAAGSRRMADLLDRLARVKRGKKKSKLQTKTGQLSQ